MRLLERQVDGGFRLTGSLLDKDIPRYPYAILSHTWGPANEEVTYEDIVGGSGQDKAGYKKIEFCGEQVARDGLRYFWVDTCCIKKSSDAELSKAINSMYRWYSRAARCYVYLPDVSSGADDDCPSQSTWDESFRASRWFSRGWTLQELLAPSLVEFFSREGKSLGDKGSLSRKIYEITGIALSALQGTSLSQFSIDERFKWAQGRQTTHEEDWAYCLLGIFDVSMSLIYGEGREKAVRRLKEEIKKPSNDNAQDPSKRLAKLEVHRSVHRRTRLLTASLELDDLLKRLPYANDAPFNSLVKQHEPTCLPDTRVDLLKEIYRWADGKDSRCIFWLSGLAGTGKSTISRTVARKYYDQESLGASFFFSRGGEDVGNARKFITSIARQLADASTELRCLICEAIAKNSSIAAQSFQDQWRQLVHGPLSKVADGTHHSLYVLVIDALDECEEENHIKMLLPLLSEAQALENIRLRIFVTSRPETRIRSCFTRLREYHRNVVLHHIPPPIVDQDITVFLEHCLKLIAEERSLHTGWPGEQKIRQMVQIASGLFIWAATACRFIREGKRFAAKRLDTILKDSGSAVTEPEKHLDEIYITVLEHSISPDYTDEEKEEAYHMLEQVLGCIVSLSSPLSVSSLSGLLSLEKEDVDQTLDELHSILNIPKDKTHPLRLHHPSFRDFILNKARCRNSKFWINAKQAHQTLADRCLQLMSCSLKQDVCGVRLPGKLATDVESSRVEQHIPLEVQYACLYWVQHVQKSGMQLRDNDQVDQFLKEHFLHWLEALGWMRRVSEGVLAISCLEYIAQVSVTSPGASKDM